MPCIPNDPRGPDTLFCLFRRHHLEGYGQWGGDMLLNQRGVREGIEAVLQRAAIALQTEKTTGGPPSPWTPEDALLDVSGLPPSFPAVLRRMFAVPRCTNTVSLYLYLVLQIFLQLYVHTFIRRTIQHTAATPTGGENYWQRAIASPVVVALIAAVVAATLSQLTFLLINRTLLPFVSEPNMLFNIAFAASLAIIMGRTEHVVLSLPPPAPVPASS